MWKQVVEGVEHRKWMSGNQIARGGVKSGVITWRRSVSEDAEMWKCGKSAMKSLVRERRCGGAGWKRGKRAAEGRAETPGDGAGNTQI